MLFKGVLSILIGILSFQAMASGTVLIDGKEIKTKDQLHGVIAKNLNFPTYYGKNLDALNEMLSSDFAGDSIVKIKHINLLKAKIGSEYIEAMIQVIMDAAEDNPRLILVIE